MLVFSLIAFDVTGWSATAAGAFAAMLASGLVVFACWTHRLDRARFALTIGAVLAASGLTAGLNGRVLLQIRDFFGVFQVTEDPQRRSHRLFHGRTLHGQQSLDPALRREPQAYFHRSGPIGQVFDVFRAHRAAPGVAITGLGAGSLACYAEPDERWTFYEIDPAVVRIARDPRYFTFLQDARAGSLEVVVGDARLRLHEAPAHQFGIMVLDAFSADAVPTHLLTREALQLYRDKLAPGGILAFHITNRYIDFDPVLGALARDAGLVCRIRYDLTLTADDKLSGKQPSIWGVMAGRGSDLGALAHDPRWGLPRPGGRVWTDDFTDLTRHLFLRLRTRIR